ncbi:MAG TPA: hypothetical protein VF997_04035, partial [Polyangia bacterium]
MTKKRGRKPIAKKDRKDQLVQTRVPGELSETLREAAKKNRVTVSQLIRNVLEDTFELVDNVVGEAVNLGNTVKRDALRIAESAKGRGKRQPPA